MQVNKKKLKTIFDTSVRKVRPKIAYWKNMLYAFLTGGTICVVGELLTDMFRLITSDGDSASVLSTVSLVFLGSVLTGMGVYDRIGRFAGAGSVVPITGFANSVVSCAMEFRSEGYIFGVGAKMFTIAGPVLVYGTVSSWLVGIVYYIFYCIG